MFTPMKFQASFKNSYAIGLYEFSKVLILTTVIHEIQLYSLYCQEKWQNIHIRDWAPSTEYLFLVSTLTAVWSSFILHNIYLFSEKSDYFFPCVDSITASQDVLSLPDPLSPFQDIANYGLFSEINCGKNYFLWHYLLLFILSLLLISYNIIMELF